MQHNNYIEKLFFQEANKYDLNMSVWKYVFLELVNKWSIFIVFIFIQMPQFRIMTSELISLSQATGFVSIP